MNLELLDKQISQFYVSASTEFSLQEVERWHDDLNALTRAVATEWSDTEEARLAAWNMVQEKVTQLHTMLASMQEETLVALKQIYRGKKSINHYRSMRDE